MGCYFVVASVSFCCLFECLLWSLLNYDNNRYDNELYI